MLYEQIVNIEPQRCIRLSESLEQSEESVENMEKYLSEFRELKNLLSKAHFPLKKQPLFVWHDRNSASWCFEEQRILHELHMMLMAKAKEHLISVSTQGKRLLELLWKCVGYTARVGENTLY